MEADDHPGRHRRRGPDDDRLHVLDAGTGAELSTTLIVTGTHIGFVNPELVP